MQCDWAYKIAVQDVSQLTEQLFNNLCNHTFMQCLQELLPLLQPDQPGGVRVLSLHGMGGISKTTLARELFNRLSSSSNMHFSGRIFLEVGQDTPLLDKQRQLIESLAGSSMPTAGSAAQQKQQLWQCTHHTGPLLLVLDDIWTAPQRDALLCLEALIDGSRIVLTGRNSSNLHTNRGYCEARPVMTLACGQAQRLLCQHAFAADRAPEGYAAAVRQALAACGGLPLALQVVGSGMRSRSPQAAAVGLCAQYQLCSMLSSSQRKPLVMCVCTDHGLRCAGRHQSIICRIWHQQ
jgi:NB-ARC domain